MRPIDERLMNAKVRVSAGRSHRSRERGECDLAGRPGVHGRRDAGRQAGRIGRHPELRDAIEQVCVKVDQAGRDIAAAGVDRPGRGPARQVRADRRDPIAAYADLEAFVDARARDRRRRRP